MKSSPVNQVDVFIVGAGPVGLLAALHFAKQHLSVVLIEQYSETKEKGKRAVNERHQQVGLSPESLTLIKNIDIVAWGEIKNQGTSDGDWINICLYQIQDVLLKELKTIGGCQILFNTTIDSVVSTGIDKMCRVVVSNGVIVTALEPKLVVCCDGKHENGMAQKYFNFGCPSKVQLSSYAIIGMMERDDNLSTVCLQNYSNNYQSKQRPELGEFHLRLLGNSKERYVALGVSDCNHNSSFKSLTASEIKSLLIEAYNENRDLAMGEPEFTNFSSYSTTPIPIVLDYRKESIKILENSKTIVAIAGDSVRKVHFMTGSGLNSGYRGLECLFKFVSQNMFGVVNDDAILDYKLLKVDKACLEISLEVLTKGIHFITRTTVPVPQGEPEIYSISPAEAEVPWLIKIIGSNLSDGKPVSVTFTDAQQKVTTSVVTIYSPNEIGVKVPRQMTGSVKITVIRGDTEIQSPIEFKVLSITDRPTITNIIKEDDWLCVEGSGFKKPCFVIFGDQKIKAYCNSSTSLLFTPPATLGKQVDIKVETINGQSEVYTKRMDTILDRFQSSLNLKL